MDHYEPEDGELPSPGWTLIRQNGRLTMYNNRRRRSRSPFDGRRGPPRQRSPFRDRSPPGGRGPGPNWRGPRSRSPINRVPPGRFGGPHSSWRRGRSPSPESGKTSEGGSRRQSPRRSPPRYRPPPGGDLIRDRPIGDRVTRESTRSPFVGNKRDESLGRDTGSINSRSTPRERSLSPRKREFSPPPREAQRARSPLPVRGRSPSPRQRSPIRHRSPAREPIRESFSIRGRANRSPPRGPAQPFRAPTGPREGQRFGEGRFGFDGPPGGGFNRFDKRPSFQGNANAIPVRSPNPIMSRHNLPSTAPPAPPPGPAKDLDKEKDVEKVKERKEDMADGSTERHKGAIVWTSKHLQPSVPIQSLSQLNANARVFQPVPTESTITNAGKTATEETASTSLKDNAPPKDKDTEMGNTHITTTTTASAMPLATASAPPPAAPSGPKVSPPIAPRGFVPSGPRGGFGGGYRGGRQSFSTDRRPSYTPSENQHNGGHNAHGHNNNNNGAWGAAPAAPSRAPLGMNTSASNVPTGPSAGSNSNVTTPATPKQTILSPSIANPSPSPVQATPTQPKGQTPNTASQTPVAIPTGPRASLSGPSVYRTQPASAPAPLVSNVSNDMDWDNTPASATVAAPTSAAQAIRRESYVSVAASTMSHNANAPVNAPSGPAAQTQRFADKTDAWGSPLPSATPSGPAAQKTDAWGIPLSAPATAPTGPAAHNNPTWQSVSTTAPTAPGGWNGSPASVHKPTPPIPQMKMHPALAVGLPFILPGGRLDQTILGQGMSQEVSRRLEKGNDEEERLRRLVKESEERKRGVVREWKGLEREAKVAGLRAELSNGCLEGLVGGRERGGGAF